MPYKDKDVNRAWQNAWMKRRRQEWVDENGPCACGSTIDLEVHHKDPTKKVTHRIWSWREERRWKELAKCIVECKKCHRGHHNEDWRIPVVHGTNDGYTHHGCRCRPCKDAHNEYNLNWQKQKNYWRFKHHEIHSPIV